MDFDVIVGIASLLGISLDDFKEMSERAPDTRARELLNAALALAAEGHEPSPHHSELTMEAFLDWWVLSKGHLHQDDRFLKRIDVFDPPHEHEKRIKPIQTGPDSLATIEFDISSAQDLAETLNGFSSDCNDKLVQAHLEAIKCGEPVLSHPRLDEPLRDGTQFTKRYRRILAPMRYLGSVVIVNYSDAIRDQGGA